MNGNGTPGRVEVIVEEAAEWLVALEDADPATRRRFAAWLKTSPEHVSEFLATASLWGTLAGVSTTVTREELSAMAAEEATVTSLRGTRLGHAASNPSPRRPARRRLRPDLAAAAMLLLTVAMGGLMALLQQTGDAGRYSTAVGEQTSLPLPDGSLMTLNTQSAVRMDYGDNYRTLYLERGEALFEVARDHERPFRIVTEHAVIQAIGTQFNVRSDADDVTVTVVEGIVGVQLRPRAEQTAGGTARLPSGGPVPGAAGSADSSAETVRLAVGEQAQVLSGSGEVVVSRAKVERAVAWKQRRLVFESLSLVEVIAEFNRYNEPPIVIEDRSLELLPISGVFRTNDRDSFIQFLSEMGLAESRMRGDGTIVLDEGQ